MFGVGLYICEVLDIVLFLFYASVVKIKRFLQMTARVEYLMTYVKYKLVYSIFPTKRNHTLFILE